MKNNYNIYLTSQNLLGKITRHPWRGPTTADQVTSQNLILTCNIESNLNNPQRENRII